METLHQNLETVTLPLSQIYLDPNNPRFSSPSSIQVQDSVAITDPEQQRAMQEMRKNHDSDKLKMNMEVNGYLPIDRIVIRRAENLQDAFIVLEGNRRITAAKTLYAEHEKSGSHSENVIKSIEEIPCLLYTGSDQNPAWLFQGIRHITGISDWSSYHKAKLLVEQMEEDDLSLTEVGRRFGLSPHGAGQWVRGYHAFRQANEQTDFIDQIDERLYPYIQELFSKSSIVIRDWMGWDDNNYAFKNLQNLNEYIGWYYPNSDDEEDSETGSTSAPGNWLNRRIERRDDIRKLSKLIESHPKYFLMFRQGADIEDAFSQATIETFEKTKEERSTNPDYVFRQIDECIDALANIPLIMIKNQELNKKLSEKFQTLKQNVAFIEDD